MAAKAIGDPAEAWSVLAPAIAGHLHRTIKPEAHGGKVIERIIRGQRLMQPTEGGGGRQEPSDAYQACQQSARDHASHRHTQHYAASVR
jgi:hypothetical protein